MVTPAIVIVWLLFGLACAFIAHDKKRTIGQFFMVGLLLGPIGLIITLCAERRYYDPVLKMTGSKKWLALQRQRIAATTPPPAPEVGLQGDAFELARLAEYHRTGVLTDAEFSAAKARLLRM